MADDIRARKDTASRRFEMSIDIDAPADAVWSALTEADELTRWFPLQAHVVPGEGGTMTWGWGDAWGGESKIVTWEPHRRLKLVETRQGYDADGKPLDAPGDNRALAVEITLESQGGTTRLRLVHSGFGTGAAWDDELDGVSTGWQFELRSLRWYVEEHRGRARYYAWARTSTPLSEDEVWRRLRDPDALSVEGSHPVEGGRFTARFLGRRLQGTTLLVLPGSDVAATLDDFGGALFRLGTFRAAGKTGVMVWLSGYDASAAEEIAAFGGKAQGFLDEAFARRSASG